MNIIEIKNNFHNTIDNLNEAELLKNFYEGLSNCANKILLNELSEEGKKEIMLAYEESEGENNLIEMTNSNAPVTLSSPNASIGDPFISYSKRNSILDVWIPAKNMRE